MARRKAVRKKPKTKHSHKKGHQTGRTITRLDKQRHAKKPGFRRSRSGKKYYEARKNRSDKKRWL